MNGIRQNYKNYSEFLTVEHLPLPSVPINCNKKKKFEVIASRTAIKYIQNNEWSKTELELKDMFDEMDLELGRDYIHNFVISNLDGTSYYYLDFVFYTNPITVVELDSWWHLINDEDRKDKGKDELIQKAGWRLIRSGNKEKIIRDLKFYLGWSKSL